MEGSVKFIHVWRVSKKSSYFFRDEKVYYHNFVDVGSKIIFFDKILVTGISEGFSAEVSKIHNFRNQFAGS